MLLARSTRAVAFAVAWLLLPAASSGVVAAPMSTLSPQVIGALGGETTAVAVGPAAVYAAVGARIQVLSPGERPQPLGSSPLIEGRVYDLTLDGERLYVAAGPAGLQVLDVSRPDAIVAWS